MESKLPHKKFWWLTDEEIQNLDVKTFDSDGSTGLIIQCDLKYPMEIHDKHRYYPLAPEQLNITEEMLSPYALEFLIKHKIKYKTQTRLAPNLYDKYYYTLHIKNLQFYLEQGLELVKIHSVIAFHQSAWLRPFIQFNIQKRRAAKTEFLSARYKLVCNSNFGRHFVCSI